MSVEEAQGRGQTAVTVRFSNGLRELRMARLTCIQAKTETPKREDEPFVKGCARDAANLVREGQSVHGSLA